MTDSKEEIEIKSMCFEKEDNLSCLRDADKKAVDIAKTILQLKKDLIDIQNSDETDEFKKQKISDLKKQLVEMVEEYKLTSNRVLKLAKMINFNVENLEYRKIDINQYTNSDGCSDSLSNDQLSRPVIFIKDKSKQPKVFICDQSNEVNGLVQNDNESICSCNHESEEDDCCTDCENYTTMTDSMTEFPPKPNTDYEKEAIRDEIMTMKGEVKLLHQQNRDLLNKLNTANKKTFTLTSALRANPDLVKCKNESGTDTSENCETSSKVKTLMDEIIRLRNNVKELERDRCQIELARKILNVSDSQCVNCVGVKNEDDGKYKNEEYNKLVQDRDAQLSEIAILRKTNNDYEERLTISNAQVAELQKQLFDLNSAKSQEPEVVKSNEKYVIENLKRQLREVNDEKTNMQMVLDFHLTELEDKKSKYLAVLQTNQEQKNHIETLRKEKISIAKEYEAEFNRMNEHLTQRLEEFGTLPGMLACAQKELEKEKSLRITVESQRDAIVKEIESLKKSMADENDVKDEKKYKDLQDQIIRLKATLKTSDEVLAENKRLFAERTHYSLQLKEHLDTVREEAAIQVTKIKDFAECQRLKYTEYIQKLEHQLAESRAVACAEFKKRDHINERLRCRIETLTTNLKDAFKQIAELSKTNELIDVNLEEDLLCKFPKMSTICKEVKKFNDSNLLENIQN